MDRIEFLKEVIAKSGVEFNEVEKGVFFARVKVYTFADEEITMSVEDDQIRIHGFNKEFLFGMGSGEDRYYSGLAYKYLNEHSDFVRYEMTKEYPNWDVQVETYADFKVPEVMTPGEKYALKNDIIKALNEIINQLKNFGEALNAVGF